MNSLQIARACAQAADMKKAEDIVILDLRGISSITDFFVIASGHAEPHLKAVRNEIEKNLKEKGVFAHGIDGLPMSQWIVMDYLDALVHLFAKDRREFYSLERLWGDAPRINWQD
ncbi:MAG: ribosome silencing factor [Verrucomicrobiae bacterium]|nr:ribosome silencing factor [Verrucomicrobiae bacterium]